MKIYLWISLNLEAFSSRMKEILNIQCVAHLSHPSYLILCNSQEAKTNMITTQATKAFIWKDRCEKITYTRKPHDEYILYLTRNTFFTSRWIHSCINNKKEYQHEYQNGKNSLIHDPLIISSTQETFLLNFMAFVNHYMFIYVCSRLRYSHDTITCYNRRVSAH